MSESKRKHRSQMSPEEIELVEHIVHAQPNWIGNGPHADKRMRDKEVMGSEIFDVLKTGKVVEVNYTHDLCVVFRKDYADHASCVVVNLPTRWIVTTWHNNTNDQHRSLDMSQYVWKANLLDVFKGFA
jgi:hypothetical protein